MIISRNSVTVSLQRDIESYYRFYKLQASTASVPVKPINNATIPPSGWSKTEPAYTEGSTNSLYFVDLTNYSDGTFEYSDVSLSSSYEAAKQAYNKAVSAGETANTANANAESKNAVFYQTEAPPTTRRKLYDVWYDTDDGAKMYYWDGAAWTAKQFGGNALGDNCIAARHIVAHSITTNEITTENLIGANGWINLAQGTFNYGDALIWDGSALTVDGTISAGAGSNIGPWTVTETSIYKTNATWGDSTAGAAYFGDNGISITDKFKVSAAGALTAVSGKIGGWYLAATRIGSSSDFTLGSGGAKFEIINETNKPFLVAQNSNSKTVFSLERTGAITILDEGPQQSQSISEWANFKIARHGSQTSKYLVATSSNVYIADGSALASLSAGYLSLQNAIGNTNYYADFGAGVTAIETNGRIISLSSIRVQTSSATDAYFHAINDNRKGFFGVSSGSNLGIYDGTNGSWVMYSDTDQVVRIPHQLFCHTYGNVNRIPIGSDNPDKYRVAQIASYTSSINIWAQWGVEGASCTARSLSVPSSDIRLKENVKMSQVNALEMINKIQMRAFDWKDGSGHWDVGFVADELEKIDPKLSIGGGKDEDGNPMYKSINDFYLLGYLTKAVQELSAENARLKKESAILRLLDGIRPGGTILEDDAKR